MVTLAIVPLQTKLVYRIAKERGFEPDRKASGRFMAAAVIGLASQMVEGVTRRLVAGVTRKAAGRLGATSRRPTTTPARTLDMPTLRPKIQLLAPEGTESVYVEARKPESR
jgi:hypothetical protein